MIYYVRKLSYIIYILKLILLNISVLKINFSLVIFFIQIQWFHIRTNHKGDKMAKGKDSQKEVKKKSEKSLKEKRNEKKEKKSTFLSK